MKQVIRQAGNRVAAYAVETGTQDRILMAVKGDHVRENLSRALSLKEADEIQLEVLRAFPWSKPGGGIVEYSFRAGDGSNVSGTIYAQLNPGGKGSLRETIVVETVPLSHRERNQFFSGHCAVYLPDLDIMLSVFPFDSRMPWLADLLDPERMTQELQEPLRRALGVDRFSITERPDLLGYRYGRRCTLLYRLQVPDGRSDTKTEIPVIGKIQYDDRGRETFQQLEQLWNRPFKASNSRPLIIPKPLCYLPEYRICFQELAEGDRLYDIRDESGRCEAMAGAAALISDFHRSDLDVDGSYDPDDEIALLGKWIRYLQVIDSESIELSRDALSVLRQKAGEQDIREYEPGIIHRDFFDKQVIRREDQFILIDLDTITISDPAVDIGNFVAHIFLRAIQRGGSRESMDCDSNVFVSAYLADNPRVDSKRVTFYTAATLFRLACLYAYRPRWSHLPAMLLEESCLRLNESRK